MRQLIMIAILPPFHISWSIKDYWLWSSLYIDTGLSDVALETWTIKFIECVFVCVCVCVFCLCLVVLSMVDSGAYCIFLIWYEYSGCLTSHRVTIQRYYSFCHLQLLERSALCKRSVSPFSPEVNRGTKSCIQVLLKLIPRVDQKPVQVILKVLRCLSRALLPVLSPTCHVAIGLGPVGPIVFFINNWGTDRAQVSLHWSLTFWSWAIGSCSAT
jgi:hypothetical protein